MIREVIVVEGVNDTKRLKSFFDVETIETHGMGLSDRTIDFIKEINDRRGVILFLDPDTPGEKIRERINSKIPGLKNAFVMKKDARTNKKVGIEHASKEILEEALNNLITFCEPKGSLSKEEFYELGLSGEKDSAAKREKVAEQMHLGKCNAKTMFTRLNMLGINKKQLEEIL